MGRTAHANDRLAPSRRLNVTELYVAAVSVLVGSTCSIRLAVLVPRRSAGGPKGRASAKYVHIERLQSRHACTGNAAFSFDDVPDEALRLEIYPFR